MGSPSYSSGVDGAEIGLVSVYDAASLELIASIEGGQEFGRFGFALSVGADGQLLVGCPRCDSGGIEVREHELNVSSLLRYNELLFRKVDHSTYMQM